MIKYQQTKPDAHNPLRMAKDYIDSDGVLHKAGTECRPIRNGFDRKASKFFQVVEIDKKECVFYEGKKKLQTKVSAAADRYVQNKEKASARSKGSKKRSD